MIDLTWAGRGLAATAACWAVGRCTDPVHVSHGASPETAWEENTIGTALHGAGAISGWVLGLHAAHPTLFWTLLVALALACLALNLHRIAMLGQRDPQRLFTVEQRNEMRRRAQGQCEHKHPLWMRCNRPGSHGDHIYPWSKGGATTLANGQWLCEMHNLRKSNKVPSRLYIWRLQMRRRRYFPADEPRAVDWTISTANR